MKYTSYASQLLWIGFVSTLQKHPVINSVMSIYYSIIAFQRAKFFIRGGQEYGVNEQF